MPLKEAGSMRRYKRISVEKQRCDSNEHVGWVQVGGGGSVGIGMQVGVSVRRRHAPRSYTTQQPSQLQP
jgi:hypothetical protein